jgi:hypothetical protein
MAVVGVACNTPDVDALRYSVGNATLVRVSYAEVLVDADAVGLISAQVVANPWAAPTWAEGGQVRVAAAVWVIESEDRRIVVDPAQAADEILRRGPDAAAHQEAFAEALASAGFARESIDTVIATHIDGIGMIAWLDGDEWTPFFPNADVLISVREHDAIASAADYQPSGGDAYLALHSQGVVTTVDDEHLVTSEVMTRWTGAHSPGHQVVTVISGEDQATMIGHLALSPLHFVTGQGTAHNDPAAAHAVLRSLDDGRLLIGPLWPAPGAVRWTGDQVQTAAPDLAP